MSSRPVDRGITALELAAGKSNGTGKEVIPSHVFCKTCGDEKRLHGVWKFGVWYCPFCVTQLELKP